MKHVRCKAASVRAKPRTYRSDHRNSSSDVMEHSMLTGLSERQADDDKGRNSHDCANGLYRTISVSLHRARKLGLSNIPNTNQIPA